MQLLVVDDARGETAALQQDVLSLEELLIDEYAAPGGQIWRRAFSLISSP